MTSRTTTKFRIRNSSMSNGSLPPQQAIKSKIVHARIRGGSHTTGVVSLLKKKKLSQRRGLPEATRALDRHQSRFRPMLAISITHRSWSLLPNLSHRRVAIKQTSTNTSHLNPNSQISTCHQSNTSLSHTWTVHSSNCWCLSLNLQM